MPTLLRIGPAACGREIALEDFMSADHEEGYQYELIDGKLYVSPQAEPPQNIVEEWIGAKLLFYSRRRPRIMNFVTSKARVFVPGRRRTTNPEPDRACYRDFPIHLPFEEIRWQEVFPFLVAEVLSPNDPDKDLVRNVQLYWQVPQIKEYWVFETRANPNQPTLLVYRRRGKKWQELQVPYGETYRTPLLPGFKLVVDPRR